MKEKYYLSPAFKGCKSGETPLDKSLNFFLFNDSGPLAHLKRKFGNAVSVVTHIQCSEKTGVVESLTINARSTEPSINRTLTYHLYGLFGDPLTAIYGDEDDTVWPKVKELIGTETFRKYFLRHPLSFDNLVDKPFVASEEDGKLTISTDMGDNVFTIYADERGHAMFRFKENDEMDFSVVECQLRDIITLMRQHSYFPRTQKKKLTDKQNKLITKK